MTQVPLQTLCRVLGFFESALFFLAGEVACQDTCHNNHHHTAYNGHCDAVAEHKHAHQR